MIPVKNPKQFNPILPEKTPSPEDLEKGMEFMKALLMRLMSESSGDILYICIHGAAKEVGIDKDKAAELLKIAIRNRNQSNQFAYFGFIP